ncbi:MAG: hypothetical protein QOI87_1342, partial [Bradyrhizobium sp.]|nr:hypothetical protein [Bradyrhizobium sp.]
RIIVIDDGLLIFSGHGVSFLLRVRVEG